MLKSNLSRKKWPAWMVLGAGLLTTIMVSQSVKHGIEQDAIRRFAFSCDQITQKIEERLNAHTLILRGGAGLFAASDTVDRHEWRTYVESLRAEKRAPGFQGVGFAQVIPPHQLAAHIARIRNEGFPEYTVRPPGERAITTSIIYLEPFRDVNLRAFGYDMFSEPVRRDAMERARDTDKAALSGKVKLVQDTETEKQAGVLIYVPVYRNGMPTGTVEQRRAALLGWTYSPYRMNDLMTGILGDWNKPDNKIVDLHIYDGPQTTPATLLFDSIPGHISDLHSPFYQRRTIDFNGHQWLLAFDRTAGPSSVSYLPAWATLIGGLALSGLLFGLLLSVINTRANAILIADKLTEEVRLHEAALKKSEAELFASEQINRATFEQAAIGIAHVDIKGDWLSVNNKLCEIIGYSREELLGLKFKDITHPDDLDSDLDLVHQVLAGELPAFTLEKRYIRKDRSTIWISLTVSPVKDSNGNPTHFILLVEDISTRKTAEQELASYRDKLEAEVRRRTAELETANHDLENFSYSVSHDLRAPLRAIDGFISILLEEHAGNLDDDGKRMFGIVSDNARKMGHLIDDILAFSRAGRLEIDPVPVEMQALVEEVWAGLNQGNDGRNIELQLDELPAAQCDPRAIRQVWQNLLGNAIKFTRDRNPAIIQVSALDEGEFVRYQVKDNGVGFNPEYVDKLFVLFQRLHGMDEFEGTGVGLAIVKRFIQKHGGKVSGIGVLDQGATFSFTLPKQQDFSSPQGEQHGRT